EPAALHADQIIARRSAAVVELDRRRDEQAAAVMALGPGQPVLEDRAQPLDALRLGAGRRHDLGDEGVRRRLEGRELQRLLGAEMSEKPALRKAAMAGQ